MKITFKEEFKQISENSQSIFYISSNGYIMALKKKTNLIWFPTIVKNNVGYSMVGVGKGLSLLHRIVAETFIPNPENKPCIDHIDGNKNNNCIENLRWVTVKENNNNPITLERKRNRYCSEETKAKMRKSQQLRRKREKQSA